MLTVGDAIARLEALGREFLFFLDAGTGRGSVVYHRYDGHYGLIVSASAPTRPGRVRQEPVRATPRRSRGWRVARQLPR